MHYVMSDIHGQYQMYCMMLRKIGFSDEDQLYVIGDAVDRGPEPVRLLLDIMGRRNVTFLIGNHEHMMIRTIKEGDPDDMYTWMLNGGGRTLEQFEVLDEVSRKKLIEWLCGCPLVIPELEVGDRKYYLAHACHTLYPEKNVLLYRDAGLENIDQVVWSREYMSPDRYRQGYKFCRLYAQYPGTALVMGHTPVQKCSYGNTAGNGFGRISRSCRGHLINIDCGCSSGKTLGCMRLEDEKEYYVDRKQEGME